MNKPLISIVIGSALLSVPIYAAPKDAQKDRKEAVAKDETHEARRIMAEAADHALVSSDALLGLVAKHDRDRIEKDIAKGDEAAYKAAGDKVQALWKKKFGEEFNAEKHIDELTGLKPTVTKDLTVIQFPAEPGEKPYELHLTRERSGWWRIQLPDTVDGKTFKKNMMAAVQKVENDWSKIPDDKSKAYERVVTELLHEMAFPGK